MHIIPRPERWYPGPGMETLADHMNRIFGMPTLSRSEREALATTDWAPSCDITETEQDYRIQVSLPDVKKDDVHVTLQDGVLTIQGERRQEREEKNVRFHRRELSVGSFMRRFTVPDDAEESTVDAQFKDGMLHVTIPKTDGKPGKTKQIDVRS